MCGKDNTMKDGGWLDNYGKKPNPNEVDVSVGPGFVGMGNDTTGRNYSPAWGGQFQSGGFLEPISYKLPSRYRIPYAEPSTELATSIGGEKGEPAYLIPKFKGGKDLKDPVAEYRKTGEHLGGPFKTWQEAEKWEQEIRHPYVEKGKPIPTPLKRWGDMEDGGYVAQKGKSIPVPTTADSLALYNNSMDLLKYYGNQKKYASMGNEDVSSYYNSANITRANMDAVKELASRLSRKDYPTTSRVASIVNPDDEDFTMQDYYGRFVNQPYKYKQRELQNNIIDLDAPFALYDTRIAPTTRYTFKNIKEGNAWRANPLSGDFATFYGYDPLAVKPYSMRTPQEKMQWEKKYGKKTPPPPPVPVKEPVKVQPKITSSKKTEPIIVNDSKDPKLKTYQDSLNLYNKNKKIYESGILQKSKGLKYESAIKGKPYGEKWYLEEGPSFNIIKKPVQPVEYKKLEEIKSTQPTPKGSKKYIVNGIEVSEEDFLGSGNTTGGGKRIIYNTPNKGAQKVLRLDGTPETDPDKIRRALATANKDEMAMGGSLPGAVGFTYARVAGSAPSNGKYAKKTKASAQNGKEMKFYQEGLDFKPNSIAQDGEAIVDPMGQWAHPGEVTIIPATDITMEGVDYPVLGISDTGDTQMMYPGEDYDFDGEYVTEYPIMKNGGWLDKYK
jgi:hypothetical protein